MQLAKQDIKGKEQKTQQAELSLCKRLARASALIPSAKVNHPHQEGSPYNPISVNQVDIH